MENTKQPKKDEMQDQGNTDQITDDRSASSSDEWG